MCAGGRGLQHPVADLRRVPRGRVDTPVVCPHTKSNNFASVSSGISVSVSYECGSTASEDQASAQNQNSLVVSQLINRPNLLSYYITDLPDYSSLAPCAASGLSYAVQVTHDETRYSRVLAPRIQATATDGRL
ncbi:hypothetical protein L209DRAFT_742693 [Thermothelomyces heterothallicus CBS 203.75]